MEQVRLKYQEFTHDSLDSRNLPSILRNLHGQWFHIFCTVPPQSAHALLYDVIFFHIFPIFFPHDVHISAGWLNHQPVVGPCLMKSSPAQRARAGGPVPIKDGCVLDHLGPEIGKRSF